MPESSAEANHVVKPADTPSAPPSSVLPAMSKLPQSMVSDLSDCIDAVTQKDKQLGLQLDALLREALERGEGELLGELESAPGTPDPAQLCGVLDVKHLSDQVNYMLGKYSTPGCRQW